MKSRVTLEDMKGFARRLRGKNFHLLSDGTRILEGLVEARRREVEQVEAGRDSADDQVTQLLMAGFGLSDPPEEISFIQNFRQAMIDLHGQPYFEDLLRRMHE